MDWINLIQWPAMAVTIAGAWFVASQRKFKRNWGFWTFLLGNLLWVLWGLHDHAYALIVLQVYGRLEFWMRKKNIRAADYKTSGTPMPD